MIRIAVVVGSVREGSFNRALGKLAIEALEAQGAVVTDIDLAGFDLQSAPAVRAWLERVRAQPEHVLIKNGPGSAGFVAP